MDKLKEDICEAFCSTIQISEFEGGYAIGTPYANRAGDNIGIYAVFGAGDSFRLIDNALTVSFLEAERRHRWTILPAGRPSLTYWANMVLSSTRIWEKFILMV